MSGRLGRHARSKWEWGTPGARSQERSAAVNDDPARARTPGKKDPDACKAAHWKGPHKAELRVRQYGWPPGQKCGWDVSWTEDRPGWFCYHEETCTGCGKILRARIPREECPDFRPLPPGKRAVIEAEIRRRRDEIAASRSRFRKPPIAGPQGYRKH